MTGGGVHLPRIFGDPASAATACDAFLVDVMRQRRAALARPVAVGLCGPQGSGKSTMAARLARALTRASYPATVLSLDDFYLRRCERARLAREVHPLLATRGVPGTHDVRLLLGALAKLTDARGGEPIAVPVFDKACDDRAPEADWRQVSGPVEVVIVEGWCIGARAEATSALATPVNALERKEDPDGRWRCYVNDRLGSEYQELFARLDLGVFLRAPSFEIVYRWRAEQETDLQRSRPGSRPAMDATALRRFISHYERLTRWMHNHAPADVVVYLDVNRVPLGCRAGSGLSGPDRHLSQT